MKRILPSRSTRGHNSFYQRPLPKSSTSPIPSQKNPPYLQEKIRKKYYNSNKRIFPFTRGCHYFYKLQGWKRMEGTRSYVLLPGKTKYRKGELINKVCIGLPRKQQDIACNDMTNHQLINQKGNTCMHKNPCHHYLFQMQDKKHNLDRIISQLAFLQKRHLYYISHPQKLLSFNLLLKDQILLQSFRSKSPQQVSLLLQNRLIQSYRKRVILNQSYLKTSSLYYKDSLNQKMFDQIVKEDQKVNKWKIYQRMEIRINQVGRNDNQQDGDQQGNSTKHQYKRQQSIKKLNTNQFIKHQVLVKVEESQDIENYINYMQDEQQHHQQYQYQQEQHMANELQQYHCIQTIKIDNFIFQQTLKLVSVRLFHQGENNFYLGKQMFLKLFGISLALDRQIKPIANQSYIKKILQIKQLFQVFAFKIDWQQSIKQQPNTNYPIIFSSPLLTNLKTIPLTFTQYYIFHLFLSLCFSLRPIKDFLQKYEKRYKIIQLLGALGYGRVENLLIGQVADGKFGAMTRKLEKVVKELGDGVKGETKLYLQYYQQNNNNLFNIFFRNKQSQLIQSAQSTSQALDAQSYISHEQCKKRTSQQLQSTKNSKQLMICEPKKKRK